MWEYRATRVSGNRPIIDSVHDGDTVRLLIDVGFDVRVEKWIRLDDVRGPELSQVGGWEARDFAVQWMLARVPMSGNPSHRWPLLLTTELTRTTEPSEIQSFARYVGTVRDILTGESLNAAINDYLAAHPEWPAGK